MCTNCEDRIARSAGKYGFFVPTFIIMVIGALILIPFCLLEMKKLMLDVEKVRVQQDLLDQL